MTPSLPLSKDFSEIFNLPKLEGGVHALYAGFPAGVENMGGSSKFDGGYLSQYVGGAWKGLKMLLKNTCEGVHLIVKLPAISLQASKFTKNELLHTHFSRILARF